MKIDVHNVTKRFGAFAALAGVDLKIKSGELVALLGPSGLRQDHAACGSSPAWNGPTRARSISTARMRSRAASASATSASCSSTTRCSGI